MKNIIHSIAITVVIILVFSCNDDFLNKEPKKYKESSPIFISPNWEADDYQIYCESVGNIKFTVTQAPSWLEISSSTGHFINNVAVINCKAKEHSDFSEVGIYYSFMILTTENRGDILVTVSYIEEGDPVIETGSRLTLPYDGLYNRRDYSVPIRNTGNGILIWYIERCPEWIKPPSEDQWNIQELSGVIGGGNMDVFCFRTNSESSLDNSDIFLEKFSGEILIRSNDKNNPVVKIEIQIDTGNPALNMSWGSSIDFGRTETAKYFEFSNSGDGLLGWKIENCPSWLTVSETKGFLQRYNSTSLITFTCNKELTSYGVNTATILLKTNDHNNPSHPITVTAINSTANPENLKEIPGNITAAFMDRPSDILYITTTQPNKLLAFDTKSKTIIHELPLSHAPTRLKLSDDGGKALIGHSIHITAVDLNNFSIIKTVEVDYNIFDIEWGADNWCCYTPEDVAPYNNQLQWKNIDTGETYEVPFGDGYIYGNTLLKKIPHQNYIMASSLSIIPSNINIFDISNRTFARFFDEDIRRFWFSSDGNLLFGELNKIYRTSSFFTESGSVSSFAEFSPEPYSIFWIDCDAASHSVWTISSSPPLPPNYHFDGLREIWQYENNDYTRKKVYYCDDYYNGRSIKAHYVFANSEGTELTVVRNATDGEAMWSLEFITVTQ